jgi:hypothetical protein
MKRLVFIGLLIAGSIVSGKSFVRFVNPAAMIEWKETSIDMGDIPFDKPVTVEFVFKNPGMLPLIISDVKSSCGCTVPDFPKQPIISGAEGKIKVTYDAKTEGYFSKTITVYSNTDGGLTQLFIKGVVVK